ncbi:MAG: DUF6152 family protein [Gammaproteobacteria bacterium]|jgi:hypothetical protein
MSRVIWAVVLAGACAPALAHHGFGRFDPQGEFDVQGVLTGLDFVNPHSYVYFDAFGPDGEMIPMRCEMRAATVLRRSGWSPDMFEPGVVIRVVGNPHLDDPTSCYVETLTLGDTELLRYQQLSDATQEFSANRPERLASGELNISGDWAQEQYLIARAPGGRGGGLVPKSMVEGIESGELTMDDVPPSGWGGQRVSFTEAGQAAADAIRAIPPSENLRAQCRITSILFDWVFDGPINRITQRGDTITFEYGRDLVRTVYLGMDEHPAAVAPSRAGHSIGRWDGDTLVVDTVGFEPGILGGNVAHTADLHVVERFSLDTDTMSLRRDYMATDPANFTDEYVGYDIVKPADAPFAVDECRELTYVDYSEAADED